MRFKAAIQTDITFQFKQGIYFIYIVITFFYLLIIGTLPDSLHPILVPLIVFSDPSLIGLFFIGGVIMLEKTQGVLTYLTITPLRLKEYILSKTLSYAFLAELAGFAIVITVYKGSFNGLLLFIGILLTSVFFTLLGFITVINCRTINQYFIRIVPYMLLGVIPCFGILPSPYSRFLHIFPNLTALELVYGAFHSLEMSKIIGYSIYTLLANCLLFIIVYKIFQKDTSF